MKVLLQLDSVMGQYYPRKRFSIVLRENACLSDLFQAISLLRNPQFSESVWNYGKDRFRGPVLITSCGKLLKNKNEKLYDGQVIEFRRCVIGG